MKKLAILVTHPIQYYTPVFKLLAKKCELKVFYTWGLAGEGEKFDKDFGKSITWDIPLLEGYNHEFLENSANKPGSHHFIGIRNPEISTRISNFNPDAILVYGWAYQSHLKVMRRFKGKIPIWFRGDSTLLDEKPAWKKLLRKAMLTWVYRHIDTAFYVGGANKAYYKAFGLKEDQLIFAPHAIDNDRFAENREKEADALRRELNIKPEDILVLFAGKLEEKKNPTLLLKAFVELITSKEQGAKSNENQSTQDASPSGDVRRTGVHLLFVGNGALEENLKLKVESLKLNNVHFRPFQNQSQMPIIYQSCDLFCLPSKGPGETWGLAVNEAMAAGKTVLVSDKVGCASNLVNSKNGGVFKIDKEGSLFHSLKSLLKNKAALELMGLSSSLKIKGWSFKNQVEEIIKALYA